MKSEFSMLAAVLAAAVLSSSAQGAGQEERKDSGEAAFVDIVGRGFVDIRPVGPAGTVNDILPNTPPAGERAEAFRDDYKAAAAKAARDSLAMLFPVDGDMDVRLAESNRGPILLGRAFWVNGGWRYGAMFDVYGGAPVHLKYVFVTPIDGDGSKVPAAAAELMEKVNSLSRIRIQDAQEEPFRSGTRPVKAFEGGRARVTVSYDPAFKNYFPPAVGAIMFVLLNDLDVSSLVRSVRGSRVDTEGFRKMEKELNSIVFGFEERIQKVEWERREFQTL